jgi:hypothetical protein
MYIFSKNIILSLHYYFVKMRFSSQDQIHKLDLQINSNKIYARYECIKHLLNLSNHEIIQFIYIIILLLEIVSIFFLLKTNDLNWFVFR